MHRWSMATPWHWLVKVVAWLSTQTLVWCHELKMAWSTPSTCPIRHALVRHMTFVCILDLLVTEGDQKCIQQNVTKRILTKENVGVIVSSLQHLCCSRTRWQFKGSNRWPSSYRTLHLFLLCWAFSHRCPNSALLWQANVCRIWHQSIARALGEEG